MIIKKSKNRVSDEWGDGGDHGEEGEDLADLVVADGLGDQGSEQRKLAMADRSKTLSQVKLPESLEVDSGTFNFEVDTHVENLVWGISVFF